MKFKQKVFLITFIFVTISINLIGIITINNNYQNLIDNRIESNKANIYSIENILSLYDVSELNSSLFRKENTYYEISIDENIIYTNLTKNKDIIEKEIKPYNNKIKTIIWEETLYMSTKDNDYEIIMAEDIKDVFENRKEQIDFFIKINIASSFIIAFCLYIIISLLTIRIDKLDKAVKQIQNGKYSTRIKNMGKDEIGNLSDSFNEMANSIDENITEIQKVSENRKNFIHDITHEIRTPLTSIIGYSSLIRSGKIDDMKTIIEYNNKIYEEGNYLNLISQRLIDIVLLDNKQIELEEINISKSLNKTIENMQEKFEEVLFQKNIQENIVLKSDEILLHSLVTNILKNSVVACENKESKTVEIILKKDILKIKDNGKGMTEEELNRVTEPFYTLNKDRNRKISGMGLRIAFMSKNM